MVGREYLSRAELMTKYRIKDWQRHFENNRSRDLVRLDWCAIPNKQDGLGYRRMLRRDHGEAAYGCFVAVVLACSKHAVRDGWLTDDGTEDGLPWDAEAISIKTGFSVQTVENMLAYSSSPEIGARNPAPPCEKSRTPLRRTNERTKERRNGGRTRARPPPGPSMANSTRP